MPGIERTIIDGMARAMYVCDWSYREEGKGHNHSGEELLDVAPRTPAVYMHLAWKLAGHFEALNRMALVCLAARAFVADGLTSYEADSVWDSIDQETLSTFGHYLAMRAQGHGVSWEDDHSESGIVYPCFEH